MTRVPFSVVIAPKTRRSSCLSVIQVAGSLWNSIAPSSLTIICVVVIVRRINCCTVVCEEVIYFLRVGNSWASVSTDRSHRKLVNWLSYSSRFILTCLLCVCETLLLFCNNQVPPLSSTLPWTVCRCSSPLSLLVSLYLCDIDKHFVILIMSSRTPLALNFSTIHHFLKVSMYCLGCSSWLRTCMIEFLNFVSYSSPSHKSVLFVVF